MPEYMSGKAGYWFFGYILKRTEDSAPHFDIAAFGNWFPIAHGKQVCFAGRAAGIHVVYDYRCNLAWDRECTVSVFASIKCAFF